MTPREILAKYGLETTVKAIKDRLSKTTYWDVAFEEAWRDNEHTVDDMEIIIKTADLDLLCEMAEKVEKITNEVAMHQDGANATVCIAQIQRILDGEQ